MIDKLYFYRLSFKETSCVKCKKNLINSPIYPSEKENFSCSDCHLSTLLKICQNSSRGCTFKNTDKLLLGKHEYWLCKYRNSNCRFCKISLNKISLFDHYENSHDVIVKADILNNNAITTFNISLRSYTFIIHAHDMKFRMYIHFTNNFIHISLLTNSIEKGADFFRCYYFITRDKNTINGQLEKRTTESLNNYWFVADWEDNIYLPHSLISKAPTNNNFIKFELNIMKNFVC